MDINHFELINRARKAKTKSPHHVHKVGTLIHLYNDTNAPISGHNYWPAPLLNTIGNKQKLGNASTTIHAEISVLYHPLSSTKNAQLYVTDLPCPNCAKILAEAGINAVYIDAQTHKNPLGQKMLPFFEQASLPIFQSANIAIHEIDPEEKTIKTLLTAGSRTKEHQFKNAYCQKITAGNISENIIKKEMQTSGFNSKNIPYAACLANNDKNETFLIAAATNSPIDLPPETARQITENQNKYESALQPFNRLIGQCAFYNLHIKEDFVYTSQTPTAREFVNMIAYGITTLHIENPQQCRDKYGLEALQQISHHNIMNTNQAQLPDISHSLC